MSILESRSLALGRKLETDLLITDLQEVADYWFAIQLDLPNATLIDFHRLDRLNHQLVKASYKLDIFGSQYRSLACKPGGIPKLTDSETVFKHIARGGMSLV